MPATKTKPVTSGSVGLASAYLRPYVVRIHEKAQLDALKDEIATGKVKPLAKNMWLLGRERRGGRGAGFLTAVAIRHQGEYSVFRVPTDAQGVIPDSIMAERILDIDDGDREGRRRNVVIDVYEDAERKAMLKSKDFIPESYRWYMYPNEMDVEQLDDPQSLLIQILTKKDKPSGPRALIISGGTQEQRDGVAQAIRDNFTIAEKKVLAGNLIRITPQRKGIAGTYRKPFFNFGQSEGVGTIEIAPGHTSEKSDVVIHEAIHALRQEDPKREKALKAPERYQGRDADLEESLTEAETVIRQRPFHKHEGGAGYYHYLRDPGKSREVLIKEDRVTGTEPKESEPWDSKPKKGKRAQSKVIKNYPGMNIRKLKIRGDAEAIDTFFKIQGQEPGKVTHVQVYSPGGDIAQAKAVQVIAKESGPRVTEWRDGKAVLIKNVKPTPAACPLRDRKRPTPCTRRGRILTPSGRIQRFPRRGVLLKS